MQRYRIFFLLAMGLSTHGCMRTESQDPAHKQKERLAVLRRSAEQHKKEPDVKKRLAYWNTQLADPDYKDDPVLLSSIHYQIAGVFFAINGLDSIRSHMQTAWNLMADQPGHESEKVLLYTGFANIADLEQKAHQENYYFSRAAQMLLADSSLTLSTRQKANIYLSAGQSAARFRQFQNAFRYNRKAISLFPSLPDDPGMKFRGYSQIATCFYHTDAQPDSLGIYVAKMQDIYSSHPDPGKSRFLADRKALYFEKKGIRDSMLYYLRKKLALDLQDERRNGADAKSIISGNLFASYKDMCSFFLEKKKLDSTLYYLKRHENLAERYSRQLDGEADMAYRKNLAGYLFADRQYKKAKREQEAFIRDFAAFYELENARSIAEMGTLIELQTKDRSITTLNASMALAHERLQGSRLWLALSTLLVLLAVLAVLFLYHIQWQRKLKEETEKVQLQQQLLRTQMEPHFIFNTLSALQSFVRFDEKEKTLRYLSQFGRLLRSSLELSRESLVPLKQEIQTLEDYLSLQRMRFDETFAYSIDLHGEQDLESIYIPPMLLQPFLENALLHGIDPNSGKGLIDLDFMLDGKYLTAIISDNGKGFGLNLAPSGHRPLSTSISRERLAILAKETGLPAGIEIQSRDGKGTTVKITIPIRTSYDRHYSANE